MVPSRRGLLLGAAVTVALVAVLAVVLGGGDPGGDRVAADAPDGRPRATTTSTTTTVPATTTTAAPTTAAPATTAPPPTAAPTTTLSPPRFTLAPYSGLGAWIDVFDWAVSYDRTPEDPPAVGLDDIDRMATLGVRTLYFQPARFDGPAGIVEPDVAGAIIDRAHANGMAVVGWYLPTVEDPVADRARIDAVAALPVDGLGIDIESTRFPDEAERNRRIVALSAELRAAYPREVLSAIVLPPVVTHVYGTYWGSFPWAELAPHYDIWQPMGYWTMRPAASGWRDAYTYTATNIDLVRQLTGRADAVVHPVGGIGCCEGPTAPTTAADIDGMVRAAAERGAPGASLYDYVTTGDDLWPALQAANTLG